jgi:long-chain fatty acid transport protein
MSRSRIKSVALGCASFAVLLVATAGANAGGLAVREQSAYGQGSSFAGVAAGGSLSSMFWNPATMTQMPGIQFESVLTGLVPSARNTPTAGSTLGALGGTNDTADNALVPSFYASWQFAPQWWAGLSVNAPYGLSVSFPNIWAGRDFAANQSHLKTYDISPTLAYAINSWISVGVGVQFQYADAQLARGITLGGPIFANSTLEGNAWSYGFTAGVTLTPTPTTTIGIGYRSSINQKIDGSVTLTAPLTAFSTSDAHLTLNLPDVVSVGLRQKLSPQWTLLGTIEWSNWSRIGTSAAVTTSSGAPVLVGGTPVTVPFGYSDGWFYSVGAEYQWSQQLALRAGVAFEKSPITDSVRTPLLPDNDRTWLSVGATYNITPKLAVDLAYSHIFVKDTSVSDTASTGTVYNGTVDSHVDIFSIGVKYRFDDPAPAPIRQAYHK